jgi:hypothetical protein
MSRHAREGFLLTRPYMFSWAPSGPLYVDGVAVSEAVYDLAYRGRLEDARTLWLTECEHGVQTA